MADKLGNNPLSSIALESGNVFSSQNKINGQFPCKQRSLIEESSVLACRSPRSRHRGFLGPEPEAFEKCKACHVRDP